MVVATLAKNISPSGYPSLHHRPPFPGTGPSPGVPGSSGTYIQYLYYLYRTQGPNSSSFLQYYQYLIRTDLDSGYGSSLPGYDSGYDSSPSYKKSGPY
uniref:Uncharacterized protein n=1 Tax=Magallana gigas TaxID=29159 RepID=A0A8W8MLB6_MAGGI